jgi:hypothetical protein
MRSSCCVCVCESPTINFSVPEPIFMKLGMHIMIPEPISTAYYINPTNQSPYLYVHPPIVVRQRLGKNVTAATNTHERIEKKCWMRRFLCDPCRIRGTQEIFFLILHIGGWSPIWVHSARRPLTGLLYEYLPRVIVRMENLVE